MKKATFGAGCFWGVEASFQNLEGVIDTKVGYMGGVLQNPTYKDVCTNTTDHAEVVQLLYDPTSISYERLLEIFWSIHDPTQYHRQGPDIGSQYRSVIFYHNDTQRKKAELSKLQESKKYNKEIVTEIAKATTFYKAEDYHQKYLEKNQKSCSNY